MGRFDSKRAVVTGGGSGIGKEVAKRFVAEGGSIVINGRDVAKLERAAEEIDPSGSHVAVSPGDIRRPETAQAAVELAHKRFGGIEAGRQ